MASIQGMSQELSDTLDYIAELDAVNIKEACEGFGTDDSALTDILCNRSKTQCKRINEQYKKKYGQLLVDELKSECSGDYLQFLRKMVASPEEADADALFAAMDGMGTTERVLTEIIVTASNAQLRVIQQKYQGKYDRSLLDHVNSEVGGDYRDLLRQCLKCERQEGAPVDQALAEAQVARLIKAAKGWGCNESEFIDILGKNSVEQTDLVEDLYQKKEGKSLSKLIAGEMGGDLEWAMLLRLESALDAQCWLLRYAMDGIGTSEDIIARVIGGASKESVLQIQARYDEKYSRSLVADLESELGGNLKKAVLKWLTPPKTGYFDGGAELELDQGKLAAMVESAYVAVAEIDAVNLKEACEGFGTDDDALTDILCFRTKAQLARINEQYKAKYGQLLLEQVNSETSGDYRVFLQMMIAGATEADCDALNGAMVGLGTTERVLSEIIICATNAELEAIKACYAGKFDRPLIDHINSEVGGDYRDFLIACLNGQRMETAAPDPALAAEQAAALHEAAKGWGTNESVFVDILSKASVEQMDLIEQSFESSYGKSLSATIKGEMGGCVRTNECNEDRKHSTVSILKIGTDLPRQAQDKPKKKMRIDSFLDVVCCSDLEWAMLLRLETPLDAQCWLLRYAMDGVGTNEDTIARVSFCHAMLPASTIVLFVL